jgi:PAS domain S-box-containing protein
MTNRRVPSFAASILVCVLSALVSRTGYALDRDRSITQFYHTAWSEKDGAPSQVSALAQTTDGYLWIGSARGLFRFDGVKFEEYQPQPGVELPSHNIYSLMATPDGGLWIAFRPIGTGFLKNGSLTVLTRPEEMPDSPIHSFALDHDGRLWAGTETGLELRQGTRWTLIGNDWNLPPEMVRDILVDSEGTLWVANMKTIAFLRRGSKTFVPTGAAGKDVITLAQAPNGRVWFSDYNGVLRPVPIPGKNSEVEDPAIVLNNLHKFIFDHDGALWVTRLDSGLVRIRYPEKLGNRKLGAQDPELESFSEKDGFTAGLAAEILEDREGNVWVGSTKGLDRFRHSHVVPVALPRPREELTLFAGQDGEVWVGATNDEPLVDIRGERPLVFEKTGEQVSSVFRDANGDIWWGSHSGVWRQRGTAFKHFPLPKDIVPDWIYEIMPGGPDGGLWIKLGDIGFVHFNQGVWNLHDWPKGVPSAGTFHYGPSATYRDPSGQEWLGYTSGHVCVLAGEKVTLYSQSDGLDVGRIKVIRGLGRQIWVGGERGLMFFSEGRFRRVVVASGEQFGAVSGLVETADGALWLNEMSGIIEIPPQEIRQFVADPNHHVNYRRFDYLDGLPGAAQMNYTNSTAVEASDGRLWFATDGGLAWIDPARLTKNAVPPPVLILSIGSEKERQPIPDGARFAPGTRTVEIDYTALSLSIPERVRFRYKLEGQDPDWQDAGTRRQAYYSNLAPRRYRFRVIACNNDGVWNDAGASLEFSIMPAYYQTVGFLVTCLAAFVVLLWALYRLRMRRIHRRSKQLASMNVELEAQIAERKQAEDALRRSEAYLAEGQSLAHFGSWAWNVRTGGTYWSEEMFRILGYDPEKTNHKPMFLERVHPEDRPQIEKKIKTLLDGVGSISAELDYRVVRPDGTVRYLHSVARGTMNESGEVAEVVGSTMDVTERKEAEEERERLRQAQADLAHVTRVSTMVELTASLAHEVNQPIAAAVTDSNTCLRWLARNPPEVEEAREAASRIVKDATRAADIIKRIRSMFKKSPTQREPVDVNEVIRDVVILLRNEAHRYSVSIRAELAPDLPKAMADRVQLQQVLTNLMLNAIDAMKEMNTTRELTIKSERADKSHLLIAVSDTGVGLASEQADRMFETFFTTKPEGIGMGLPISRSIIEAHGGRLWATANQPHGAVFQFTLPAEGDATAT